MKCVAMPAPSVRYALGEAFGLPVGTVTTGKMLSALKALGFSTVGTRISRQTSPYGKRRLSLWNAWAAKMIFPVHILQPRLAEIRLETFYPEPLPHFSSCKSPIGMNGALAKTYGAQRMQYAPKDIYTVSIMPCIAKKYEGLRPELNSSGTARHRRRQSP